jgi:hypothetical protein
MCEKRENASPTMAGLDYKHPARFRKQADCQLNLDFSRNTARIECELCCQLPQAIMGMSKKSPIAIW